MTGRNTGGGVVNARAQGRELPVSAQDTEYDEDRSTTCVDDLRGTSLRPVGVECAVRLQRGPYAVGLGWAPQGQEWLIVAARVGVDDKVASWRGDGGRTDYTPSAAAKVVVAVGGQPARKRATDGVAGEGVGEASAPTTAYLVPAASSSTVTLTVTVPVRKAAVWRAPSPRAPKSGTVVVRQVVRISPS